MDGSSLLRVTHAAPPWEPPLAGSEVAHLLGALDRLRATFRWKADGLDAGGLQARVGASSLTLGGLLKHLAAVEDHVTTVRLSGAPMGAPWSAMAGATASDDWDFTSAAGDDPQALYDLWDGAVERARARVTAALPAGGLDQLVHSCGPDGHASLRRLVCDLIEEYGRHTGHADLLREAVDGRVGEDPPEDWRSPRFG